MPEDKIKKTIFIVEDDPMSMRLAVDLLNLNGFNAVSCTDAREVMNTLAGKAPDLILLDINMPFINGFEVFKKIRGNPLFNNIKVAAMSASVMKEDELKIKSAGFDAFIKKPIDIKNFIAEIIGLIKK